MWHERDEQGSGGHARLLDHQDICDDPCEVGGNPATQYQSGVDLHFDWGASQFLTKQLQVGVVGYVYDEIGCDSGVGHRVGCFQSRVIGIGPQLGYIIPLGTMQAYINLKGYGEFDAQNRAHGWNTWLTVRLAPAPPSVEPPPSATRRMYTN
jgi:hypothetical protein